jgi:hypothetical protein
MPTTPTKNPERVWPTRPGGEDILQLRSEGGDPIAWIDSNGAPQGNLIPEFPSYPSNPMFQTVTMENQSGGSTPPAGELVLYSKLSDKRLYYKDETGTEIGPLTNSANTLSSPVTTPNPLAFDVSLNFKGPVPWVDVTRYGVRAVTSTPSTTATINASSMAATLAAASTFQNGDGIVIYGAGAVHSMSTPLAPTVTPSVARVGTSTGDIVAGPSGSTTYNYQIVARDINGGLTAAGTVGSTATGATSLGPQSVSISSMSRSNNAVTVVTATAHGLVAGAMVNIYGATDPSFNGWYQVASTANNTHFVYNGPQDTNQGATSSTTGGTVYWYNCNHLSWTAVTGAWQYYIYGRTGSSLTLLGVTKPLNAYFTDFTTTWDDFGSPMMDYISTAVPPYVPSSAPSSATSDNLITTIASGGGTTSIILSAAAGTSVSGATAIFDDGVNFKAAVAANPNSTIYIPPPSSGSYPFNSLVDLRTYNPVNIMGGYGLALRETLAFTGVSWKGNVLPIGQSEDSFSFGGLPAIYCYASPSVYSQGTYGGWIEGLEFYWGGSNNALLWLCDGGGGGAGPSFKNMDFNTAGSNGGVDYNGIALLWRGCLNTESATGQIDNISFNSGPAQVVGTTATPSLYIAGYGGQIKGGYIFFNRRSAVIDASALTINFGHDQGGIMPCFILQGTHAGGNTTAAWEVNYFAEDTMADGVFAYLPSAGTYDAIVTLNNSGGASSGYPTIVGNPIDLFILSSLPGSASVLGTKSISGSDFHSCFLNVSGLGYLGYQLPVPSAPTAAVSSGGTVPVGTYTFEITAVDILGNQTTVSAASSSATTTTGNQTITITPPILPAGSVGWITYVGISGNYNRLNGTVTAPGTALVWNGFAAYGGSVPSINAAAGSSFNSSGASAPVLTLVDATPTVSSGQLGLGVTTATSATAGSNGNVPAQVVGYLEINIGGTMYKIPYYAV